MHDDLNAYLPLLDPYIERPKLMSLFAKIVKEAQEATIIYQAQAKYMGEQFALPLESTAKLPLTFFFYHCATRIINALTPYHIPSVLQDSLIYHLYLDAYTSNFPENIRAIIAEDIHRAPETLSTIYPLYPGLDLDPKDYANYTNKLTQLHKEAPKNPRS